jgi:hypothetical protein
MTADGGKVVRCAVPSASAVSAHLAGADFHDCYGIDVPGPPRTALDYFLRMMAATPAWVETLMTWRNRLVQLVGLRNLGGLGDLDPAKPASAYAPGDRVGIFTLLADSDTETLLGDSDKHLDVVVSVCKLPVRVEDFVPVAITTVVHVHNLLGRLYMLPVTPLHKIIAPAVASRLAALPPKA